GCAAPRALLERLQRGRRVLPSDPDPGAGARSPRRPARSGNRLSGLPSCRRGLGLRGIRRPAGRDPPCAGSRVRRRGAALSAIARCHALRRPETGDRVTWQLRRADAGDLESIMRLETAIFGSDAWSSGTMRDELANANTWYLVAFRPETPESIEAYAGLLSPRGAKEADIQTIAVAEGARRGGLGRTLVTSLVNEARKRGATEVFLEVRADNPGAQA